MKKIVVIAALLYVGYAYGDSLENMGANLVEKARPMFVEFQESLQK